MLSGARDRTTGVATQAGNGANVEAVGDGDIADVAAADDDDAAADDVNEDDDDDADARGGDSGTVPSGIMEGCGRISKLIAFGCIRLRTRPGAKKHSVKLISMKRSCSRAVATNKKRVD